MRNRHYGIVLYIAYLRMTVHAPSPVGTSPCTTYPPSAHPLETAFLDRALRMTGQGIMIPLASHPDTRYVSRVIMSFADRKTEAVFNGRLPKGFPTDLLPAARRKLGYLHAATTLNDLRAPPGNRLEALSGDRVGQHSIRVNDQFRVCFVWKAGNAEDVEIVDYH